MVNSMSYKGYIASMVFDAEDKIIVGRVLDIEQGLRESERLLAELFSEPSK